MLRIARTCAAIVAAQLLLASVPAGLQAQAASDAAVALASSSAAQLTAPVPVERAPVDSTARTSDLLPAGALGSAVALRMRTAGSENAPAAVPQTSRANSTAMMVVGLAAVVAGIVVGDEAGTILVLAGAGIGLYGLYKYLQ
jgi:hypothetical protein